MKSEIANKKGILSGGNKMFENDGIYMEVYVVRDGVRYNVKTIGMQEVSLTLTAHLMDGIEELCSNTKE